MNFQAIRWFHKMFTRCKSIKISLKVDESFGLVCVSDADLTWFLFSAALCVEFASYSFIWRLDLNLNKILTLVKIVTSRMIGTVVVVVVIVRAAKSGKSLVNHMDFDWRFIGIACKFLCLHLFPAESPSTTFTTRKPLIEPTCALRN